MSNGPKYWAISSILQCLSRIHMIPSDLEVEKAHARKRILLLGLMAASSKVSGVPNIYLSGYRILKMNMRKA